MKSHRFLILIITLWAGFGSIQAQQKQAPCATMEMDSLNRAKFPQRGRLEDFEDFIQQKISEIKKQKKNGRIMAGVQSIPIIVHVVHNGESPGSGTNISKAQVQAQIDVLNEDFRKKAGTPGGASNNPVAADIEIEFCLATVDQAGTLLAEPGIHRYNGGRSDWSRDQIEGQLKPDTHWDPSKYFNIWTVKFAAADANLLGYAQFPDQSGLSGLPASGPEFTDGVVIRYQSFGSTDKGSFPVMVAPYNKGRTLSHETGHWLGLRHIWGDGACEATDFVDDTPSAAGPSSGCNVARFTCNHTNMVQNYMDYSDDACMNIFTEGQKVRMQAVMLNSPRRKALTARNLCDPPVAAPPVTNFTVDNPRCVLVGSTVSFTDLSSNSPSEWHWIFEGADQPTSEESNPKVKYSTPGTFYVSLWSKNKIGISDTLKIEGLIVVTDEGICRDFNNFKEGNTPSNLKLSDFGNYSGYLTGSNSLKSTALAEFFNNECGYVYISGLNIRFGKAYTLKEDAKVNFVVWNARGPQNAPGAVIERKVVLFKQIQDDIENNRPTSIIFDRESPVFGKPFQVGIELDYDGDSLAIISSANGEGQDATSWIKDTNGVWSPIAIAFGANVAMDIQPVVGMNPSVQVAASTQLAYPGQTVTMNGRGASIFVWNSDDGVVNNFTGPQLIVNPSVTTTYIISGSGLELCNAEANTTIYVSDAITGVDENSRAYLTLYPNPGNRTFHVHIENKLLGPVEIKLFSITGQAMSESLKKEKTNFIFDETLTVPSLTPGMYFVRVTIGKMSMVKKWVSKE
jgi:PKD repeat protein